MRSLLAPMITAALLAVLAFSSIVVAEDPYTIETLRLERETAKWRNRDLIYNNDGGDMLEGVEHTPQGLLDARSVGIVGSQVDSLFYCVDTVGMVYYDSQVSEVFTTTDGRYYNNMTQDLLNQGTDAMKVMVDFSRQNDIEVFCSLRMNDTHDASGDRLTYSFPEVKTNNPDWIMGSGTSYGAWSAFDFGQQGVRDLTLDIFTEICTNYDVDGIELDFLRHPFFFRSHAFGGTATEEDLELMTQLVRDIRTMTEQVGLQREKPILVSVRVPDSMSYAEDIGLDVTQWLEEDLFDMMAVSCHFRAEEWSESVALGHQYDVPVYAGLSESRMTGEAGTVRKTNDAYYARAAGAWEEGVDGIYMFNYFNDESELWDVVGDPETLQGRNKVYTTSARGVEYMSQALVNGIDHLNKVVITPEHPLSLQTNQLETVPLSVGDDLSAVTGTEGRARLRLRIDNLPTTGGVFAFLGNQSLGTPTVNDNYLDFVIDSNLLIRGLNEFKIGTNAAPSETVVVNDFQLWVSFRPDELATPILYEPFHVATPANASQGQYATGSLIATGNSPASDYFTTNWTTGHGTQTARFEAVAEGMTYKGMESTPGSVRFTSDETVSGLQSVKREFDASSYTTTQKVFYLTGMMSFDENFSTDDGSYAMTGLLNAEEGSSEVPWTIGMQWGFVGNGNGGVDAVLRYRRALDDWPVITTVIGENVTPGEHLFVMKVQAEANGSMDYLTVWLDPDDTWSETEAGLKTDFFNSTGCWLLPTGDPARLVDTLVLSVNDIGDDTSVLFDEIRLGTDWYDLFMSLTEPIAGDANGDGKVDGSDVTILAGNWQYGVTGTANATWEMGDFNGDGKVDGSDVTILAGNWQYGVATDAAAVPEPSTLALLFSVIFLWLAGTTQKRNVI